MTFNHVTGRFGFGGALARASVLLGVLIMSGRARAGAPVIVDRERMQRELAAINVQLSTLQQLTSRNPPVASAIAAIERQVTELSQRVGAAPIAQAVLPPAMPTYDLVAMDEGSFRNLVRAISAESFSSTKLRVLQDAANTNYFSAAQLAELIRLFDFSKDKVRAVELVAPRLCDRQNAFQVYDSLEFLADKKRVQQILSR